MTHTHNSCNSMKEKNILFQKEHWYFVPSLIYFIAYDDILNFENIEVVTTQCANINTLISYISALPDENFCFFHVCLEIAFRNCSVYVTVCCYYLENALVFS